MIPGRDGQPPHLTVHIDLNDLRGQPGGSVLERSWTPARAAAGPGSVYLTGPAAEAAACDAVLTPMVTGQIDWAVLDQLTTVWLTAHGHGHTAGPPESHPAGPRDDQPGGRPEDHTDGPRDDQADGLPDDHADGPRDDTDGPRDDHADGPRDDQADGPRDDHTDGPQNDHADGPQDDHADGPQGDHADGPQGDHAGGPRDDQPGGPRDDHAHGPRDDQPGGPRDDHAHGPRDNHADGRPESRDANQPAARTGRPPGPGPVPFPGTGHGHGHGPGPGEVPAAAGDRDCGIAGCLEATRRRLQATILRWSLDLLSGPGGLASQLRGTLLGAPFSTPSHPLDLGRTTRTIPPHLRTAVIQRDQHCQFPGCTQPPSVCDVHHLIPWANGGPTSLANLRLLCRFHHLTVIHRWRWTITCHPDGTISATAPAGRTLHSHGPPQQAA